MKKKIFIAFVMLLTVLLGGCQKTETIPEAQTETDDEIFVQYFYENICEACDPEAEFLERFTELTGISLKTPNLIIDMHNVYKDEGAAVLEQVKKEYNLNDEKVELPIIRINDTFHFMTDLDNEAVAQELETEFVNNPQAIPSNASVIIYFSSPSCKNCSKAKQQIISKLPETITINNKDSEVVIIEKSVASGEGLAAFKAYCEEYGVNENKQKVPMVFVGYKALSGYEQIKTLPDEVAAGSGKQTIVFMIKAKEVSNETETDNIVTVLITGLINGFNPCALSMAFMLLALLVTDQKNILKIGLGYCLGKFIGFLLLGTVLYNVLDQLPLTNIANIMKIVLMLFAGSMVILNSYDMIMAKQEKYGRIILQLPEKMRQLNHQAIEKYANAKQNYLVIGAIGLGVLLAGGEFLCAGQIYLAMILNMAHNTVFGKEATIKLIVYCIMYILPLVAIVVVISRGKAVFGLTEKLRNNLPLIKLLNLVVFALFFVLVFFLY